MYGSKRKEINTEMTPIKIEATDNKCGQAVTNKVEEEAYLTA